MKILHVEAGKNLYGGALQVLYLLRGLQARQCQNILVCPNNSAIANAARDYTERLYAIPMRGDIDIPFIWRLKRILEKERPDIVHLHSRRGADVFGGIAARIAKVPVVYSRRVDNPESPGWVRIKYRLFDKVVAISKGIRQVLLAEGVPGDKIECVPSAVDINRYAHGCDRQWFMNEFSLPQSCRVLAMVAQLIPRKGHRLLLEVLPEILQGFPDVHMLLFGKGAMEEELSRALVSPVYQGRVRLAGFRDDLERIMPCLHALVHPAEMEGLGVSLLQAAAAGIPIVGTNVGGIPEIVYDGVNGYLVPPRSSAALSKALNHLLSDNNAARAMGEQGRRIVVESFSISAMVAGNWEVYQAIVK